MAFPVVWDLAIIRYSLTNKQPQKRGEIYLAFIMYKTAQTPFLTPMRRVGQTSENHSVYAGFKRFALL